jgi:hypothetical protein
MKLIQSLYDDSSVFVGFGVNIQLLLHLFIVIFFPIAKYLLRVVLFCGTF